MNVTSIAEKKCKARHLHSPNNVKPDGTEKVITNPSVGCRFNLCTACMHQKRISIVDPPMRCKEKTSKTKGFGVIGCGIFDVEYVECFKTLNWKIY